LACHSFSWRSYCDPDFKTPEEYEKARWEELLAAAPVGAPPALPASMPVA